MTLDLSKIKSDAEKIAANSDLLLMALPVKDVLGMLAEIECFDEGMRNIASFLGAGGYNDPNLSAAALVEKVSWGVGYVCDIHESQLNNLKAENEALRKQIADLSPFKNATLKDFRASNKCLACGEYHHGLSGLPCPKMTPVAQALAGVNQRVVPVEPLRIPHPLDDFGKERP